MSETKTFEVELLTRVEGEGKFWLEVEGDRVVGSQLSIFEAPRFFEAFLRGRAIDEVADIVARICGICPIAYQMSATSALEMAADHRVSPAITDLRRLMYCGEWIESHALHVFMLHAPDFFGFPSAVEMAAEHRELVERGLRLKKAGNRIVEVLGGRAIHPVSVRVGGFSRIPTRRELANLRAELQPCLDEAEDTVRWAAALPFPEFRQEYTFVALRADRYPLETGDALAISGRAAVPLQDFADVFIESHVEHSNALQCRLDDGTAYLTGPLARIAHFSEKLHPRAATALQQTGLPVPILNPFQSIVARAVEILHAFAEALDLIDAYVPFDPPFIAPSPRDAVGFGCSEAPRGLCWHRYETASDGTIVDATIVPPTSQNQARIEQDLVGIAPELLALSHDDATHRCEQLIRSYDPCISCATHFLSLEIERH